MSRGTEATRAGLLALAIAVSAGIHAGLVPEHLEEMPRLGYSFIVAAVLGGAMAVGWALALSLLGSEGPSLAVVAQRVRARLHGGRRRVDAAARRA